MERYSKEDLDRMTVARLQNLDFADKDQELLIQSVLDVKREHLPLAVDISLAASATDNLTPEKEAELQKTLDEKKLSKRETLTPIPEEVASEEVSDVVPSVTETISPVIEEKKPVRISKSKKK